METSSGSPRAVGNIHGEFFFNDLIQIVALIHLQTHSIMNLVVGEGDVVLEDVIPAIGKCDHWKESQRSRRPFVPLLQLDLGCICSNLRSDQLLEISDSIIRAALYANWWIRNMSQQVIASAGADSVRRYLCVLDDRLQ